MAFTHRVPRQLQDEDRWFKIFTLKQAIAAVLCGVIGIPIGILLSKIHLIFMLICMVFYVFLCGFLIFFKVPANQYMLGGGQHGVSLMLRCLVRRITKKIYVKNLEGADEWDNI